MRSGTPCLVALLLQLVAVIVGDIRLRPDSLSQPRLVVSPVDPHRLRSVQFSHPGPPGCDFCLPIGGNSSCRRVSGIFTRPNLPLGYNVIARIPQGACYVSITELRVSKNYLALRDDVGGYVINGRWSIDRSGPYRAAGTTFTYKRHDVRRARGESLTATGPLTEALYLLLIYQQPNLGIKYEYSLPESIQGPILPSGPLATPMAMEAFQPAIIEAPIDPQVRPHHHHRHQRTQHHHRNRDDKRITFDALSNDALLVEDIKVDDLGSPGSPALQDTPKKIPEGSKKKGPGKEKGKNKQKKMFRWKVEENEWSDCSVTCGSGTKSQKINCVRMSHNPEGRPFTYVDERHCRGQPRPTANQIPCGNNESCPGDSAETALLATTGFIWKTGPWGECSVKCGVGSRIRAVSCIQLTPLSDEGLTCKLEEKPIEKEDCYSVPCTPIWLVSEWDVHCKDTCSPDIIRKRRVICSHHLSQTEKLTEETCDRRKRPQSELSCLEDLQSRGIDCRYVGQWMTGSWSQCSVSCGISGWQTRTVVCLVHQQVAPRSNCSGQEEPPSRQICNPDPCPVDGELLEGAWYTSDWRECSRPCGGMQERDVLCLTPEGQLTQQCPKGHKPQHKRNCSSTSTCDAHICEDKDSYCHLVARARLCRYEHYRARCCSSCAKLPKS